MTYTNFYTVGDLSRASNMFRLFTEERDRKKLEEPRGVPSAHTDRAGPPGGMLLTMTLICHTSHRIPDIGGGPGMFLRACRNIICLEQAPELHWQTAVTTPKTCQHVHKSPKRPQFWWLAFNNPAVDVQEDSHLDDGGMVKKGSEPGRRRQVFAYCCQED